MTKTKSIYRLIFVALAAAIALCAVLLMGCSKDSTAVERGDRYYLYNEGDGTFDYSESIRIDGEKCTVYVSGDDGMKDLVVDGTVTYDGDVVKGNCGMIVTKLSEFMSQDGLDEMYEELGVTKLDIEFTANIKFEFTATKYSNFLAVTYQSMTIRGFTGLLAMLNDTQSSSTREVYCKKGQTPDYSVDFTIDFDGGTYNGKEVATFRTDKEGNFDLSTIKATRDGYVLYAFSTMRDFTGYTFNGKYRFYANCTIYALWNEEVVITLDINSTEYKVDGDTVIRTGEGMRVPTPKIVPTVANPTTRFKAWYNGYALCFDDIYFYTTCSFSENATVKAEWYSATEVENYNNSLSAVHGDDNFIIHFMPKYFSIKNIGSYGGSSLSFSLYSVKDGQKDTLLGANDGIFNTTDKTGKIFKIDGVSQAYNGDVCLVVRDNGELKGSVIIPKSELGVSGNQYQTHIFLNENDLSTYSTRW